MFSFRKRISSDGDVDVDVLAPGDLVGEGLPLKGHTLSVVANTHPAADSVRVIAHQGKGSYAVVYQAQEMLPDNNRLGPRKFAIKCLSKRNLDDAARAEQMAEVTIHQSLRLHPNIVTLYRTLQSPDYLLLLLEFVEGDDLFYFLEHSRDDLDARLLSPTRLRRIASMFAQMCHAVAACHLQNVFHRDIKPENFIVTDPHLPSSSDRTVCVKLTDFGLSTTELECSDMDCGSAPYMSYECRNNIAPTYKPRAADVWSLGIVLINMLYHINPWTDTAHGACQSFETFRSTPAHSKFQFFVDRFPGMTKPVAEMLANRVFCILEDPRDDSMRIEATELGKWVRTLPDLLAEAAVVSPTTALLSSPTIEGMVPLSLVSQQRHHRRTTSTSTSPSVCPSPALAPAVLPPSAIQGHRLSLSMRISHRPTSRSSRPASLYSASASNRNSLLVGSPALGGRLPLPMPIPLSRAPSLAPALEREEFGSKERLVDDCIDENFSLTSASSNGTVVAPLPNGLSEEPEVERGEKESAMNPPSARRRKRGARGKQTQAGGGGGQMMNIHGTQTPPVAPMAPMISAMNGPSSSSLSSSSSSQQLQQDTDATLDTLAAASQTLARKISSASKPSVVFSANQVSEVVGVHSRASASTITIASTNSSKSLPLSVFTSKFGGGSSNRHSYNPPASNLTKSSTGSSRRDSISMCTMPSALMSRHVLPAGKMLGTHHVADGANGNWKKDDEKADAFVPLTKSENEGGSPTPPKITKKWRLSLRKGGAAAAVAAAIEEASTNDTAPTNETASSVPLTAATTNSDTTTRPAMLTTTPPSASLSPSTSACSGGTGSFDANAIRDDDDQHAMSTTANKVRNLVMGLDPAVPHSHQPQQQQRLEGSSGDMNRTGKFSNGPGGSRKWRRMSRDRDGLAIEFGTSAMGSFGAGASNSPTSSIRSFGTGGQMPSGSNTLCGPSPSSSAPSGRVPSINTGGGAAVPTTTSRRHQRQPLLCRDNPHLSHLQQERERVVVTPTSLRGGGGAFNLGHNNGRHHTSSAPPPAVPFTGSSSSSWRNSMSTMASTSMSMFTTSASSTSAAASVMSPGGSSSTKYSNPSQRSVSTTAASASEVSWRGSGGGSTTRGVNEAVGPNGNANGNDMNHCSSNMSKTIKPMDAPSAELGQPRGQTPETFGSPPTRKQRTRHHKKTKQDTTMNGGGPSSATAAGGPLDTINEKPMSGETGTGTGSVLPVEFGNAKAWRDVSTSTTDLVAREEEPAITNGGTVKKVNKGQITALAKMLSALRR